MAKEAFTIVSCAIPRAASLSNPIDCSFGTPVQIIFPPAWNEPDTLLTAQASFDSGTTWMDLYTTGGRELIAVVVVPGASWVLQERLRWVPMMRLRSGPAKIPVPQSSTRNFQIIIAAE